MNFFLLKCTRYLVTTRTLTAIAKGKDVAIIAHEQSFVFLQTNITSIDQITTALTMITRGHFTTVITQF